MKDHRPVVDGYLGRSTRPGQAIAGTEAAVSSGCRREIAAWLHARFRKTPSAVALPRSENAGPAEPGR